MSQPVLNISLDIHVIRSRACDLLRSPTPLHTSRGRQYGDMILMRMTSHRNINLWHNSNYFTQWRGEWSWSHGNWIYNYFCNQCLSLLKLSIRFSLRRGDLDKMLWHKVCQWLVTGRWFSPSTQVSSTYETDSQYWDTVEGGVKHNSPNRPTPNVTQWRYVH